MHRKIIFLSIHLATIGPFALQAKAPLAKKQQTTQLRRRKLLRITGAIATLAIGLTAGISYKLYTAHQLPQDPQEPDSKEKLEPIITEGTNKRVVISPKDGKVYKTYKKDSRGTQSYQKEKDAYMLLIEKDPNNRVIMQSEFDDEKQQIIQPYYKGAIDMRQAYIQERGENMYNNPFSKIVLPLEWVLGLDRIYEVATKARLNPFDPFHGMTFRDIVRVKENSQERWKLVDFDFHSMKNAVDYTIPNDKMTYEEYIEEHLLYDNEIKIEVENPKESKAILEARKIKDGHAYAYASYIINKQLKSKEKRFWR